MNPEIADDLAQLDAILERFERLAALAEEAFARRPAPEGWSAAECLDHLNKTTQLYLPAIGRAVERAEREGRRVGDRSPRRSLFGRWFIAFTEPPARRPVRAPGKLQPAAAALDREATTRGFREIRAALRRLLERADGLDLWKTKIRSPILPLIRLSLGEVFALLAAHDRRHLDQAERAAQAARVKS